MTGADRPEPAVAVGGPLDGAVLGAASAARFQVRMEDGSTHVYVRSTRPAGSDGQQYDYAGRG